MPARAAMVITMILMVTFNSIAVMKKLMKSLMLFAAAAMALTSCENEAMNEGIEANDTYTMNFVTGAPKSKTSVTIDGTSATFSWDDADDAEDFVFIQHNGEKIALGTDVTFTKNGDVANISATFTGNAATEYNHVTIYPASAWVDGTDVEKSVFSSAKLTVKNKQNLVNGKYDRTADLMVSKVVSCVPTAVPQALQFTRLVSVAEMNIKNLAVEAGEKITSVDFAVSESVIAGRNYYDLATGKVVEYGYSDSYRSNNITLSGEGIDANSTSVKVYFTCNPVTVATGETYTVTVTTDKAKYTKSAELTKDLAFEAGKVKAFGVNMTGATKENLNDLSGTYIIVAKGSINYYYMSTWKDSQSAITDGNNRSAVDSGVSEITDYTTTLANFENIDDKYIWNVTAVESGYTLSNKDNSAWLYLAENNNRANMTTTKESAGTFSIDKNSETNVFTVVDKKYSKTLAYNSSSAIFACYASGQNPSLYFIPYVEDTRTAQNLSFGATTEFTITLGEEFTKPTLTGAITTVTYSSSDTNVAEVNASTGVVTIKAAGTAIITATAPANDTYKSGSASYTVTVKEKQQAGAPAWTLVTSLNDITADAKYILVANGYALANTKGSKGQPLAKAITISNNTLVEDSNFNNAQQFNIVKGASTYTITVADGTNYLYCTNDNNGLRIGTTADEWKITSAGTNVFYFQDTKQSRYLSAYNNQDWRCYTGTGNGVPKISIYKLASNGEEPETPATPTELVMSDVICSAQTDTSLTFTWTAVANATAYQIYFDGADKGTTTELSYVATGLTAGSTHTIAVKAVGDGVNYTTSSIAKTVQGTTTNTQQGGGDDDTTTGTVVLSEEFDNTVTAIDNNTAIGTTTFANFSGATEKAYKGVGGIKFGTSSLVGYITSKALDLSSPFTVKLDAGRYKDKTSEISVTVGAQTKTITNDQLKNCSSTSDALTTFTLEFDAATNNSTIKISTTNNGKRAVIDNVIVTVYK